MPDELVCEGKRVYLRNVALEDASLLAGWKTDPVVQRMALGPGVEICLENQAQDIANALNSDDQLYLLIIRKEDDQPIGYIRINWMDDHQQHAWLRFALGEARSQGYAGDALRTLLDTLFARHLHRVEAEVFAFNHASLRLLSSLGFEQEGRKRQAHFSEDGYCDVLVLGLLAEDWRARRLKERHISR